MATSRRSRKHVSKLVPDDLRVLTPMLIAVAVVNSATTGYDGAVMNGLLILPSYSEYFKLTTATEGLNNAAIWIGGLLGAFLCQPIPDYFGRKTAILISASIVAVGVILQGAAQHIAMFVVARIIIGIGSTISNGAAPTLLSELLQPARRAWVLGLFFSCYYVGSLLSSIVNFGCQNISSTWAWRIPSLLQIVPSLIAVMMLPFVPESPRWLVANGRTEEAQEVMVIMQGKGHHDELKAETAVSDLRAVMAREAEEYKHNPWIEIYYLTKILGQAGVTNTTTQTQIQVIINCWSLVVAIVGSFTLDKLGRRLQTFIGTAGMVVMLCVTGGLIKRYGNSTNKSGIYGALASIFLFQGFYAFSITPMTSLYPTEVSPFKLRTTGVALCKMLDNGGGLLASFAFAYALEDLSWKFYFINAAWDFVFLIIAYFTFVETKGMQLEEIAVKFGDHVPVLHGDDVGTSSSLDVDHARAGKATLVQSRSSEVDERV